MTVKQLKDFLVNVPDDYEICNEDGKLLKFEIPEKSTEMFWNEGHIEDDERCVVFTELVVNNTYVMKEP